MNETRKFLRYITPGALFGILAILFMWITLPRWTEDFLRACIFSQSNSIAIAVGFLLGSGVLGYFFTTLHHCCHWYLPSDKNIINHTKKIAELRGRKLIPQTRHGHIKPRLEALITISVLWYERLEPNSSIKNSEERAAAFGDLAHAAGTARVAAACALVCTIIVNMKYGKLDPTYSNMIRYALMLGLGAATTWLFHDAYRRTGKISQYIYEEILENALVNKTDNAPSEKKGDSD